MGRVRTLVADDSSVIRQLHYDLDTRRLQVYTTTSGTTYWEYYGVPPWVFAKLCTAQSLGGTYNRYVRDRFECARIESIPTRTIPPKRAKGNS